MRAVHGAAALAILALAAFGWLKVVHDPSVRRDAAYHAALDSARAATDSLAARAAARDAALTDTLRTLRADSAVAHRATVAAAHAADRARAAVLAVSDSLVPRRLVVAALAADSAEIASLRAELTAAGEIEAELRRAANDNLKTATQALAEARVAQSLAARAPRGSRCGLGGAAGLRVTGGGAALVVGVVCVGIRL